MVKEPRQAILTPLVWTRRMLDALSNGVKRGKWYSLYDKVYSMVNLEESCERVLSNKGKPGIDCVTVSAYNSNRLHNLKPYDGPTFPNRALSKSAHWESQSLEIELYKQH